MEENDLPKHYRINDFHYREGITIKVEVWNAVRKTPQGYWVQAAQSSRWGCTEAYLKKHRYLRWVSATSTKRWCYPRLDLALKSFLRRRQVYAHRLSVTLAQVETVLKNRDKWELASFEQLNKGVNIGQHPMAEMFHFD